MCGRWMLECQVLLVVCPSEGIFMILLEHIVYLYVIFLGFYIYFILRVCLCVLCVYAYFLF